MDGWTRREVLVLAAAAPFLPHLLVPARAAEEPPARDPYALDELPIQGEVGICSESFRLGGTARPERTRSV